MNKKIPYTPLSTHLSGSAGETELRLRNIFSGPKKRPPALFLALVFSSCVLCGNLVSCQSAEAPEVPGSSQSRSDRSDLLSEEELAQFNEIFFEAQADINYCLPVNGFFNSRYDDVTELDFVEFLRYYPGDGVLEEEDAAEFEALSQHPNFPWKAEHFEKETLTVSDLPVPIHRILRSSVDETLKKYAGITASDLNNTEEVLYLPEYDAYYNFTSDFGPGSFRCVSGKKDGNILRLWSDRHSDGSRVILTLREADGNFYIKSLQTDPDGI